MSAGKCLGGMTQHATCWSLMSVPKSTKHEFSSLVDHTLQVVSSAIVDKYIGESARLIREMFGYAKEHQPCIIFMDEIDAIGGRRFSEGTSADREIQRTLMELLSQLDGFDVVGKVRAIMWSPTMLHGCCVPQLYLTPNPHRVALSVVNEVPGSQRDWTALHGGVSVFYLTLFVHFQGRKSFSCSDIR